ncbi:MAG: SUMF1/EgtB/PvdO family nonheme iron enzyme [Magnetococcales bacterium]|nr:SUMF1/EgtB/PvdO family nonheme iron enzyme [Magnetococcales bacterium]
MKMRLFSFMTIHAMLFFMVTAYAAPPATLGYQGRLSTSQGVRVNGPTDLRFRIYDADGAQLWEESQTGVQVADGIFTVILGKTNALTGLAFDKPYYLGVAINGGNEMTPRMEMSSAPYAMNTVKQSTSAADAYIRSITMPKSVTVSPSGSGQATVTWNAVDGATSYNLYLATETGVSASNYITKANGRQITGVTSPYTVTGLTNGAQYFVAVASVTPVGESVASLEVKATMSTPDQITNSLGMTFKLIPSGTFLMGSPPNEGWDDKPQHTVTISKAFYIQTTEATQGQWKAVMTSNPSSFPACGDNCPVESMSWNGVQTFIANLNAKGEGIYRLPTEAEWEYAARAGTSTTYSWGASWGSYNTSYAWFAQSTPKPVATKLPNPWGLYDMHGNVWELVSDWYASYSSDAQIDPLGPSSGSNRTIRGGGWLNCCMTDIHSAQRGTFGDVGGNDRGFRLVKVP